MAGAMYKFISYEQWTETETITSEDGSTTEVRTNPDYLNNPNSRASADNTEVVISCNDGSGTHTKEEALAHIEANWPQQEEPEV
nr:hypothetical protein [uncultured Vibrio sp.]